MFFSSFCFLIPDWPVSNESIMASLSFSVASFLIPSYRGCERSSSQSLITRHVFLIDCCCLEQVICEYKHVISALSTGNIRCNSSRSDCCKQSTVNDALNCGVGRVHRSEQRQQHVENLQSPLQNCGGLSRVEILQQYRAQLDGPRHVIFYSVCYPASQ
jgi:hypothetical protein